ncbi:MAG: DUF3991 and toprim domain-containing protein [Eubacteriales bacterium]
MTTYIHFTEEQKKRANTVDLVEFLQMQGEKLLPSGREKRLSSDRSITVRGNEWYDHALEEGGLPIDFVQSFYGLSFPEAVTMLLGGEQGEIYNMAKERRYIEQKPFELPPKNSDMRRVFAYLIKNRYIDRDVVSFFAKKKLLYESCEQSADKRKEYHNAVFVGYDENGVPCHAHKRGIYSNGKSFKSNVESSNPCYSFHYTGTSNRLYVFEAPIDILSFITINKSTNWQEHSYVALCGVSEQAMLKIIENNPNLKHVILCLDHDIAGIESSEKFQDILYEKKIECSRMISKCKDWNEDIKESLGQPAIPSEEHPQYIILDEVISEIREYVIEIRKNDISHSKLNALFEKCNANDTEQMVVNLKQLSALSLCLASNEYRQMGYISEKDKLLTKLHDGFKAYENRSKFNNRLFDIKNELKQIGGYQGIICKNDKKEIAKRYEAIAGHCLKAIITIEIQQQKQEQKQLIVMS